MKKNASTPATPKSPKELFRENVESGNIPSYWHVVEVKTGNEHNTYPFEANYSLYDTSQDIDGVWSWKMDLRYGVQLEYIAAYPKRDDDPAKRGSEIVSAEAPDKDYSAVARRLPCRPLHRLLTCRPPLSGADRHRRRRSHRRRHAPLLRHPRLRGGRPAERPRLHPHHHQGRCESTLLIPSSLIVIGKSLP